MEGKILIADDETDIVVMLSQFFQGKGYRILTATNGVETLKQVENNPDIILLDINMPGMDFGLGLYICKILCEHHGGYLKIENCSTGANATAFFKSLDL